MIQVSQDSIKKTDGSVASPKGYLAKGVHCGLRYSKKDLGIIISSRPAVSAAVYTQSHFQAAPIKVTQESLKKARISKPSSSTAPMPTHARESRA